MKGGQTHYFATTNDLVGLVKSVEIARPIKYAEFGLVDSPQPVVHETLLNWAGLGRNSSGKAGIGGFLVVDKGEEVKGNPVPQRKGDIKFSFDQAANPHSIILRPSGLFDENTLIVGSVGTISDASASMQLYKLFRDSLDKNSVQVGYARVCMDAMEFMKNGGRMVTIGVGSPAEFDLRL
jgi:hypothetical protein